MRSLTRASVVLDGDEPSVTIAAAYAKNRRQDTLLLRADTAALLNMFRADLADARRAWIADAQTPQERKTREERLSWRIVTSRAAGPHVHYRAGERRGESQGGADICAALSDYACNGPIHAPVHGQPGGGAGRAARSFCSQKARGCGNGHGRQFSRKLLVAWLVTRQRS